MAAIDKTFGTRAESQQVWNWLLRHRSKFLRYHYGVDSYDHLPADGNRTILNTPTAADKWLARYCPIPVVLERIVKVYPSKHPAAVWASKRLAAIKMDTRHD